MAIGKDKHRFEISMNKKSYEMIEKVSKAYHMSKSEFIECCCLTHIQNMVLSVEKAKQKKKEKK